MTPFRVAIVGCGAVTRASLLPVLAGHDRVRVVALVDRDLDRARELASAYGITRVEQDVASIAPGDAEGIVLATPPAHHARATVDALSRGFHVFVEKPMAITAADAQGMVDAAARAGRVLSVGLYRRLLPAARLLRAILESGRYGRPLDVDIEEGGEYGWQLATLSVLTKSDGGGGVLIDLGSHLIDQLFFMVPGTPSLVGYADNSLGGIETDCVLELRLDTRWGAVPARVELSRTRELRGSVRVRCERATIELRRPEFCRVFIEPPDDGVRDPISDASRPIAMASWWEDEPEIPGYQAFKTEFDDWLLAIAAGRDPHLSGRSVLPVVQAIQQAYQNRRPLLEPWTDDRSVSDLAAVRTGARRRVLVTGAGGFLGCRTVEILHASGAWHVRALVRRPASAARLARLPVEIVLGDVTSPEDVRKALDGCDAVVHCAVGTGWPPSVAFTTTVEGTRTVADAALAAGIERFVHVSSMAVHGERVPPRLDEHVPLEPGQGFDYGHAKYLAEQAVRACADKGLSTVMLRPARIYGPHSRTFTVRPLNGLRTGSLILEGDAESPANMVYVDNVVAAIIRALDAGPAAAGEAFLVSEPDQLSWRAFYGFFADAGGRQLRVIERRAAANEAAPGFVRRLVNGADAIVRSGEVRALAKKIMATEPYGTLPRRLWDSSPTLQRRTLRALGVDEAVVYREPLPEPPEPVEFRIDPTLVVFDKAVRVLGYDAPVPRERAMRLTLEWARAARLI